MRKIKEGSISEAAFHWKNESKKNLDLEISKIQWDLEKLPKILFSGFKRPVHLILTSSAINFVPEQLIRPFLEAHKENNITIEAGYRTRFLQCKDCRNVWMLNYQEKIKLEDSHKLSTCEDTTESYYSLDFSYCKTRSH